ncbi:hypothetical protein XCM_22210 (plasmid) [Xanthomonas citri pv. mangiferaeindicae]|nr:hypothetical protein XCM_22210 [Xanthomonas citri pv. mangiferaeindicae]
MEHVNRNFSLSTHAPPQTGRDDAVGPAWKHESIAMGSAMGNNHRARRITPDMGSPIEGDRSQPVGSELPGCGESRNSRPPHDRGGFAPYSGRTRLTQGEITPHKRGDVARKDLRNQRLTSRQKLPCMYCLSIKSTYNKAGTSKANAQRRVTQRSGQRTSIPTPHTPLQQNRAQFCASMQPLSLGNNCISLIRTAAP